MKAYLLDRSVVMFPEFVFKALLDTKLKAGHLRSSKGPIVDTAIIAGVNYILNQSSRVYCG
jgi:hypothetical protein